MKEGLLETSRKLERYCEHALISPLQDNEPSTGSHAGVPAFGVSPIKSALRVVLMGYKREVVVVSDITPFHHHYHDSLDRAQPSFHSLVPLSLWTSVLPCLFSLTRTDLLKP
jgi:hypothetical protein